MSVVKGERGESNLSFLYKARELHKYTIQKCVGFPKRYTFYVGQPLADLATEVHLETKKANGIYPKNKKEAQLRRNHLLEARASLQAIVAQIELASDLFDIESKTKLYWMSLVDEEIKLLSGVLESDKTRFKNLPD